jgi:hypothetical protein
VSILHQSQCPECGYTCKPAKTARIAEYALRRHSCERQRHLQDETRRKANNRTRSGVVRDCEHKQVHHEHGTKHGYILDKCRCRPCTDAARLAEARRRKAQAFGRYDSGRTDAAPVREHLKMLMANGVSLRRASELTGISMSTLGYIVYGRKERGEGPRKRVLKRVALAVLTIQPSLETAAPQRIVDGTGSRRRIEALATLGYSVASTVRRVGMIRNNAYPLMHKGAGIEAVTAIKIRELYDELWNKPYEPDEWRQKIAANRTRNMAAQKGWAPPLAWDDETIDNPKARPRGVVRREAA